MEKAVGILVVVAVSVFAGAASAQMTDPGTGMMGRGMGWGYFGPGMTLGMMFVWGVVIVGLVVGIGWLVRQGRGSRRNDRGH